MIHNIFILCTPDRLRLRYTDFNVLLEFQEESTDLFYTSLSLLNNKEQQETTV